MIKKHQKNWNKLGNQTRYFVITGGRGSGKSFEVGRFTSLLSFEVGHRILFTRQTMTSAHLSIIPEFKEKIDLLDLNANFEISKSEIKNKQSGSEIIFRGIKTSSGDQTANLKSLQGVTTWIVDEAEELTDENTFDKINLSIRQKGKQNRIILILNPSTKEHWIYKKFFEEKGVNEGFNGVKDDVTYIHTTYLDNIDNLDTSFIKEVERIKENNPTKYQHQILGGWLDKAEGVIFTNWSIGKFENVGTSVFGQDFGFSNDPTTLIETSIDKANKKIYCKLHYYKTHLTTSDILQLNISYANNSLIVADSAEPRLIAELQTKLNIVGAVKGPDSVIYGISLIQDYELIVDSESIELIKELNNYCWLERKSKTPIDMYNHAIDALRYAVSYQLSGGISSKVYVY
jgi:phage terminase large subunit